MPDPMVSEQMVNLISSFVAFVAFGMLVMAQLLPPTR